MDSVSPFADILVTPIKASRTAPPHRSADARVPKMPDLVQHDMTQSWQNGGLAKHKQIKQFKKRRPRNPKPRPPHIATGRWSKEEHQQFIKGLAQYGKEWKKVAALITSRTIVQIRTHAQKYFQKIQKQAQQQAQSMDSIASIGGVNLAAVVAAVNTAKPRPRAHTRAAPKSKRPRATRKAPSTPKKARKNIRTKHVAPKLDSFQSILECEEHLFSDLLGGNSLFANPIMNDDRWLSEFARGNWSREAERTNKRTAAERLPKKNQSTHSKQHGSPTSHIDMGNSFSGPVCGPFFPDLLAPGPELDEKMLLHTSDFGDNLKDMEDLHIKDKSTLWLKDMALGDWGGDEDFGGNNRATGVFVR